MSPKAEDSFHQRREILTSELIIAFAHLMFPGALG